MARKGRFTEARIYVAGSSIALLLGVWGLFASQDARSRVEYLSDAQQTDGASVAVITGDTAAPASTDDDDEGDEGDEGDDDDEDERDDDDDDDRAAATQAPTQAPTPAPTAHSRTSGS